MPGCPCHLCHLPGVASLPGCPQQQLEVIFHVISQGWDTPRAAPAQGGAGARHSVRGSTAPGVLSRQNYGEISGIVQECTAAFLSCPETIPWAQGVTPVKQKEGEKSLLIGSLCLDLPFQGELSLSQGRAESHSNFCPHQLHSLWNSPELPFPLPGTL